jgi:hypothetical protein
MYVRPIRMYFDDSRGERTMLVHVSKKSRWQHTAQAVTRLAKCQRWEVAGPGMTLLPGEFYPTWLVD